MKHARQLSLQAAVTSERLSKMGTDLVVVGCGGWRYIKEYQSEHSLFCAHGTGVERFVAELLNLPYPVFANPR